MLSNFVTQKSTRALSLLLSILIAFPQATLGSLLQDRVVIAFVGISFTDVPEVDQKRILNNTLAMIQLEPQLNVLGPEEAAQLLGEERYASLFVDRSKDNLALRVSDLGVDYILFGELSNNSRDTSRVLLVGHLHRYDRESGTLYSMEVLKYSSDFHEVLAVVQKELIQTVIPEPETSLFSSLPVMIIAGVAFIGVAVLLLTKGQTQEGGNLPPPPEQN